MTDSEKKYPQLPTNTPAELRRMKAIRSVDKPSGAALVEHVADGIVILQKGRAVFVNDALCSMLKHPADRLLRIAPVDLFREQDREAFLAWFHQTIQGDAFPNLQAVCRTGDGQEIWTEG